MGNPLPLTLSSGNAKQRQAANMAHTQLLRIKKLTGCGILKTAARHNLREIQAELGANSHINPAKSLQNVILQGAITADALAQDEKRLLEGLKKTIRKDAVRGLEVLFSLPPDSGIAEHAFFADAVSWAGNHFEVPILSAVIHNDEAAPHCHVLMLPLFDGRMIGSGLVGSRKRLQAMQADFFEKVASRYGLERKTPARGYSRAAKQKAAAMALDALRKSPKLLEAPAVRDALLDLFEENPARLVEALGFAMPEPKAPKPKTFAGIMTKQFKPEREKPIGFASA